MPTPEEAAAEAAKKQQREDAKGLIKEAIAEFQADAEKTRTEQQQSQPKGFWESLFS